MKEYNPVKLKERINIIVNTPEIGHITVDGYGKIIDIGVKEYRDDWRDVYIDLEKLSINKNLWVSWNKTENEKIGLDAVFVKLKYKVKMIRR